jgi:hypothetical protein
MVRIDSASGVPCHRQSTEDGVCWRIVAALGVLIFGTLNGSWCIILSVISLTARRPTARVVIGAKRGADVLRGKPPTCRLSTGR